ncbi:hypothetical protein [Micrococcus yunnanensis]|uniref:hypothetical protein n=1 Tax=Micrococcus yunnanensis TaxID=566027 RepID=UPI00106AFAB2|nr:hypothetical protein [Micrococcus yunnanensis]MCV7494850.1 hypothetical protein [Micrococcus luteus]TFE80630.1 hypothetical protein E2F93_08880 [Micrococcus yunnanensis]
MFHFIARDLLRALDVAAMPARQSVAGDVLTPDFLLHVPVEFTDQGLIAYSTDRYQLVRTLAEYAGDTPAHGEGPTAVRLHRDGVKTLLPALKAAKRAVVSLSADADTVTLRTDAQTVQVPNVAADGEYPKITRLFRLHQDAGELRPGLERAEPCVGVNPHFLHGLATVLHRYAGKHEAMGLSLDQVSASKPVAWMFDDWAQGLIMPVKTEVAVTRERAEGGLGRLFDAVPLMAAPEVATARASTRGTQVSAGA